MGDRRDIAEIDPVLELTLGPNSLVCTGCLNTLTRRHVLEALEVLLDSTPQNVDINVSGLHVADADGAHALVIMQNMVGDAGASLRWRGLNAEHVLALRWGDEGVRVCDSPGLGRRSA
jgi:anti-anti-sigma regulatory factor